MRISAILLPAVLLTATPVLAHPDHDAEAEAPRPPQATAREHIIRLVSQAKLPASWSHAAVKGISQRTIKGASQTIVTFANPTEKNAARQSYSVAVDAAGNVVAADYKLK